MFDFEPKGHYHWTNFMAITPFWFLTEHPWTTFMPFWRSADDTFMLIWELFMPSEIQGVFCKLTVSLGAPVFDRYQFFGSSEHYGKTHWSLLSGWMNYNYTACGWFPTSSNISILPSQFWQIRFESCWLRCLKCRILVLLRYYENTSINLFLTFERYFFSHPQI